MIKKFSPATFFLATNLFASLSLAQIFVGDTGQQVDLDFIASAIAPGRVVIISEQHGFGPHHQNQRDLIAKLSEALPINVGMEFFSYPDQQKVDDFANGRLSEADFLTQVGWGGVPFANYSNQVLAPYAHGGKTLALNMPRSVTGKISKLGLASLAAAELALMPPTLTLGNAEYLERFKEAMGGHIDPLKLENYFTAHCVWDETMAWQASEFMRQHPTQILVIIVGDFHVAYEDGLVERLRDHGFPPVVISQVSDEAEVAPHPRYGRRGDFVWLSR